MRPVFFTTALLLSAATAIHADTIGVAVNGTCKAGSCPAAPLPVNTSDNLPVDVSVTLANGDTYLIFGSFQANNGDGASFTISHDFEVMYGGNEAGGPSDTDTINVEQFESLQATVGSVTFNRDVIGAFSSDIASSSSINSCVDGMLGCVGPASPPGDFSLSTSFPLASAGGTFEFDPTFTTTFGAGSPMGSFVVWGDTTALPPPAVPEPRSLGLLAAGLGIVIVLRAIRSLIAR